MKRGIITNSGKAERINNQSVQVTNALNEVDINYYVLYWDNIVMPTNNIIHVTVPHEEILKNVGILERPVIPFTSWSGANDSAYYDPFIVSQIIVANELLNKKSDIDWTIHQIGEEIIIPHNVQKEFQSLKVELFNCLPVPSEKIHPEILLEFKEKRKTELESLHNYIDELYLEILKSPDIELQKKKTFAEFTTALQNLEKVSSEKFTKSVKYNLITELNLSGKDLLTSQAAVHAINFFHGGINIPIASIIAGLISMIKVKANMTVSLESSKAKKKLSYLANASKNDIIKN